ncbi:hypothetical protein FOCG_16292 [Fusarium oxysporum f. sp. radicis-lycopersici 26381]|nr:hypothetical protein FOCG_16292 [Fusarium oxysporum f. sp. radicis-lycopersici 26381]
MFFVELCAPYHRPSGIDKDHNHHTGAGETSALDSVEGANRDIKAEVGTTESNSADLDKSNKLAAQLSTLFILEFSIIFHSILIGITLAIAREEFIVLYVMLVFHQTLKGLGLGSRLAIATWPPGKAWLPYFLSALYALSTPIAIAAGLSIRNSITPGTHSSLVIIGVFDAISARILLYTGLISLIAYDFFTGSASKGQSGIRFMAFGCIYAGAGIMALLGYWA